jgi:phosphate transport system substrate-binding protein
MANHLTHLPALTCPNCRYDANPPTAKHCEVCGHALNSGRTLPIRPRKTARVPPWITLGLLALLGLGSYIACKAWRIDPKPIMGMSTSSGIRPYNLIRDVENVPSGLFNYAGGVTFANLTAHGMHDVIAKAHPQFRLRYTESLHSKPGSGTASTLLINGQTSFAQTARPLNDQEYSKAQARGFSLEQVPVSLDGIAFYTHPDFKIPGLSLDQVQNIFMGKLTNWKQVGGPNLPIRPFSQDPQASSVISLLLDEAKGQRLGPNVRIIYSITDAIRKVANTPGGISYSSPSLILNQKTVCPLKLAKTGSKQYIPAFLANGKQVNIEALRVGTYPLTRRLFIVFRRDGTLDEQAGVAYTNLLLSNEGQRIIETAGFVPIR